MSAKAAAVGAVVGTLHKPVFVPIHLNARDDGRFANSPLKEWFDRLASRNGLCCAFADGIGLKMSTGTRRTATIVYEFRENG
jgi:hypothetical protein